MQKRILYLVVFLIVIHLSTPDEYLLASFMKVNAFIMKVTTRNSLFYILQWLITSVISNDLYLISI